MGRVREDAGSAAVAVRIVPSPKRPLTLLYQLQDGTATEGGDFSIDGLRGDLVRFGELHVPAGATEAAIPVTVIDDDEEEAAESAWLVLEGGRDVTVGPVNMHQLSLVDDDASLETLIRRRIAELERRTGEQPVNIWRRALAAVKGEASPDGLQKLTRADAQWILESHEEARTPELAALWRRIIDVLTPFVSVSGPVSVNEGDAIDFQVTADRTLDAALTVSLDVTETGGVLADGATDARQFLTLAAGVVSASLIVRTAYDATVGPAGSVTVTLAEGGDYKPGSPSIATVSVLDVGLPVEVRLEVDTDPDEPGPQATVTEQGGAATVRVTASIEGGVTFTEAKTVRIRVGKPSDDAAEGDGSDDGRAWFLGNDYERVDDFDITIPAGATSASGTFTLKPIVDNKDERDESLSVEGTLEGATVTGASVTITGGFDPPLTAVTISIGDAVANEGDVLLFEVTLSAPSPGAVSVHWLIDDAYDFAPGIDRATKGEDYWDRSGVLEFPEGETLGFVTVATRDDAHDDPDERLAVRLVNPVRASLVDDVGIGTILNSDPLPAAWLGRFGRTVAESVLDGISTRMAAARKAGFEGDIGGHALPQWEAGQGAQQEREAGQDKVESDRGASLGEAGIDDGFARVGTGRRDLGLQPDDPQGMTGRELLLGSRFSLTGELDGSGGSIAFWGGGSRAGFKGSEDTLTLDGEVTTGMLGVDHARGRWLTGLVLLQSVGEGSYGEAAAEGGEDEGMAGEVRASLKAAVPWAAWQASERLMLLGAAGYGAGEMSLVPGDGDPVKAGLDWTMATIEMRSELLPAAAEDDPMLNLVYLTENLTTLDGKSCDT